MIWTIAAAAWLATVAADALVIWRLARRRPPGLNTVADAEAFVTSLRITPLDDRQPTALASRVREIGDLPPVRHALAGRLPSLPPAPNVTLTRTQTPPTLALTLDMRTPIFDALERDRRRRVEALRMPTQEMRVVFDRLVEAWKCSHCTAGDCDPCPGCSCSCKLPEAVAA